MKSAAQSLMLEGIAIGSVCSFMHPIFTKREQETEAAVPYKCSAKKVI